MYQEITEFPPSVNPHHYSMQCRFAPLPDESPRNYATGFRDDRGHQAFMHDWETYDEHEAPLVFGAISQQDFHRSKFFAPTGFAVYPSSVRIGRDPKIQAKPEQGSKRGDIDAFSEKSRRRLRFAAVNAFPALSAQFVLTYPAEFPQDGRESKKHLNAFLTAFRRRFKGVPYLWVLEFQRRGAPHYHLFFSIEVNEVNRRWLAETWVRIACEGSASALAFHSHEKNLIAWDMGNGQYVCKYLEKERQKDVPEGYLSVGRFWGSSRGLVPRALHLKADEMGYAYRGKVVAPVTRMVRTLVRYHQKITTWWCRENDRIIKTPVRVPVFPSASQPVAFCGPLRDPSLPLSYKTVYKTEVVPAADQDHQGGLKRVRPPRSQAQALYGFAVTGGKQIFTQVIKWYDRQEKGKISFSEWSKRHNG